MIETMQSHHHHVILIQRNVRRWIVQKYFRLQKSLLLSHSPQATAADNRSSSSNPANSLSIYVNDTDFYTLEKLDTYKKCEIIGIRDSDGFVYGFWLHSLIIMYNTHDWIINPYNRKVFSFDNTNNLFQLLHIGFILFHFPTENGSSDNSEDSFDTSSSIDPYFSLEKKQLSSTKLQKLYSLAFEDNEEKQSIPASDSLLNTDGNEEAVVAKIQKRLDFIRKLSLKRRVEELFIEIDMYGNYTKSSWFHNLRKIGLINFYNILREIWYVKASISEDVKHKICPFGDPFREYLYIFHLPYMDIPMEKLVEACVYSMENMVYTSHDLEMRKLACLYIISAFTVVCIPARMEYYYLFESVI